MIRGDLVWIPDETRGQLEDSAGYAFIKGPAYGIVLNTPLCDLKTSLIKVLVSYKNHPIFYFNKRDIRKHNLEEHNGKINRNC